MKIRPETLFLNVQFSGRRSPAWVEQMNDDSSFGSSWSFVAVKKVENEQGIFIYGDIYSPRGGLFNCKENGFKGMVWVPINEWECSDYQQ